MKRYPTEIQPDHPPMLSIGTAEGLLATAQWNVIEYPTQNALGTRYSEPDRMVFDIDPGEGVSWQDIQQAAQLVRGMLEHLGLNPSSRPAAAKACTS
jgi:bifunctional non-homologous end joining protein LigD